MFGDGGEPGGHCHRNSSSTSTTNRPPVSSTNQVLSVDLLLGVMMLLLRVWWVQYQDKEPLPTGCDEPAVCKAVQIFIDMCDEADGAILGMHKEEEEASKQAALHAARFAGSLAVLAEALGAVATPLLCNNPSCSNLTGRAAPGGPRQAEDLWQVLVQQVLQRCLPGQPLACAQARLPAAAAAGSGKP
jgi:hypothetical protein